jgi:flagellar assembly protein FliH
MYTEVIPQENLTSYQRWQLSALHPEEKKDKTPEKKRNSDVRASLERAAIEDGYKQGYAAGKRDAQHAAHRLAQVVRQVEEALAGIEQGLAGEVVDLAIDVARQVLRCEVSARRDVVLAAIREAMSGLPELSSGRKLLLHPIDVETVRSQMGDELHLGNWQIVEDHMIEPAGCKVISTNGEIDATLETRWKRTIESLHRSKVWDDE